MDGRHAEGLIEPELVELARLRDQAFVVGLVGHEQNLAIGLAKQLGHSQVQRDDALADVHHEEDQVGLLDGLKDLVSDVFIEAVRILDAVPAGIYQLEADVVGLADGADAVARHAGDRIDDADPLPGQAVQQGTLADVRSAYDRNDR